MFLVLNSLDHQIMVKSLNYNYLPSNDEPPRLSLQLDTENANESIAFLQALNEQITVISLYNNSNEEIHTYEGNFEIDGLSEDISEDHHSLELVLLKK